MAANAVIIEPKDTTRESAVELLEKQGFDVTEYDGWKPDFTISGETTFCFVEAKTLEEHREILDEIRSVDESLPVFVVGPEKLSRAAVNAALEAGMVQWVLSYDKAVNAAVQAFRSMMKRVSTWQGRAFSDTPAGRIEPLKELHDPETGRVAAGRIAAYLGVSLAFMAKALGRNYSTVAKTPAAESLQESLRDFKRVIEVLQYVFGDHTSVRVWMNSPHPDLSLKSPREVAEAGKIGVVRDMLESALAGNPS
jgi:hypothetical protein